MLSHPFSKVVSFLNSDAKNKKNITICYFALFFLISIFSSLATLRYLNRSPDATIFNLKPSFGPYIKNIVQEGSYYYKVNGITFYALRLPLIPYFMSAIAYVHNSISFAFFIKSLIACFFTAYSFKTLMSNTNIKMYAVIIALFCICFIPYNINIMLDIDHEEGYSWALILLFFSLLVYSMRYKEKLFNILVMSILLVCLILTKSSYVYLGIFLALYLLITLKSRIHKVIPLSFTLSAILLWGIFTYNNTGHFAFLNQMSSWNGENLYKGNSEYTIKYYPKYHVDILSHLGLVKADRAFSNEWEFNRFFANKAKSFIINNPFEALRLAQLKAQVFFVDIRELNVLPRSVERFGGKSLSEKAMYYGSMIINRILLFLAVILSIYYGFFGKLSNINWKRKISIAYLFMVIFYALPYIIGHANYRHIVPLIPLTTIFLIWVSSGKDKSSIPTQIKLKNSPQN